VISLISQLFLLAIVISDAYNRVWVVVRSQVAVSLLFLVPKLCSVWSCSRIGVGKYSNLAGWFLYFINSFYEASYINRAVIHNFIHDEFDSYVMAKYDQHSPICSGWRSTWFAISYIIELNSKLVVDSFPSNMVDVIEFGKINGHMCSYSSNLSWYTKVYIEHLIINEMLLSLFS
jgi:hypothetical protein